MRSNKMIRLLCILMTLLMLLPTLASCGSTKTSKLPDKVVLENVYKTEYLGNAADVIDMMNLQCYDGELYGYSRTWEEDDEGNYKSDCVMYAINLDDKTVREVFRLNNKSEYTDTTSSNDDYSSFYVLSDGTFIGGHNHYFYDSSDPMEFKSEEKINLVHVDADGNIIKEVNTKDVIPDTEYFYINRITDIPEEKQFLVTCGADVYFFDYELNLVNAVKGSENDWISGTCRIGNGDIVVFTDGWDETTETSSRKIRVYDKASKTFSDLPAKVPYDAYEIMSGPDSTIYYNSNSGIRSFDIMTGENKMVVDWLNSDINSGRIQSVCPTGDGRFFYREYDRNWENSKAALLSPVSSGEVTEKYVLNIAGVYINEDLKDMMINFNKQNEEYRICFNDYSVYNTEEDYDGGITQLNNDIISGKIPDIIDMNGLDFDTYASKGILADIGKLMDEDESFDRSKYLENVFEACSYKGKLLSIIPSFSVATFVGKEEIFGDVLSLSMETLDEICAKYPDASVFLEQTRSGLLYSFCANGIGNFIDYENGKCSFDSPEFCRLLELMKTLPEEINYDDMPEDHWQTYESAYRENRALIESTYVSDYNISYRYNNFGGPVSFVGFPGCEDCGSSVEASMEIALSAKSPFVNVGWDFIKSIISEENQDEVRWNFPILRSSLEKKAKKALEEQDDGMIVYEDYVYATAENAVETEAVNLPADIVSDDGVIDILPEPIIGEGGYKIDQSMIDKVNRLLENVKTVSRSQGDEFEEIYKILEEETGAFFASQKSAQDVAKIIQSRVQLFVQVRS